MNSALAVLVGSLVDSGEFGWGGEQYETASAEI